MKNFRKYFLFGVRDTLNDIRYNIYAQNQCKLNRKNQSKEVVPRALCIFIFKSIPISVSFDKSYLRLELKPNTDFDMSWKRSFVDLFIFSKNSLYRWQQTSISSQSFGIWIRLRQKWTQKGQRNWFN